MPLPLRVVSGSRDTTLRVWDVSTGRCEHVLTGHVAAVRCVQYDGRRVVSGGYDYMVKVWDPETEVCLHTLQGHTNRVYSLQVRTLTGGLFSEGISASFSSSFCFFFLRSLTALSWSAARWTRRSESGTQRQVQTLQLDSKRWRPKHHDEELPVLSRWVYPNADRPSVADQRHGAAGQHPGVRERRLHGASVGHQDGTVSPHAAR